MTRVVKRIWQPVLLVVVTTVSRVGLLRVFDVELSNDGFDAVNTLRLLQTQGPTSVPRELIDRFILHPLHMVLLVTWRWIVPPQVDSYLAARLLSVLFASLAVLLMFEVVRAAFDTWAAWTAALLLAFTSSFLWESITVLSSALFLFLYLAGVLALQQSRFRLASGFVLLAAMTRYEGLVLAVLTGMALVARDCRQPRRANADWFFFLGTCLSVPLLIVGGGWLMTGDPSAFIGAQSMAALWLRALAPGDFLSRAPFFLTQYDQLMPAAVSWLGLAGVGLAILRHRSRTVALLIATSLLFLVFFEMLLWFDYITLAVRFLMYPAFPVLAFAGVALSEARRALARVTGWRVPSAALFAGVLLVLAVASYQQGMAGMRFIYNMHASQRQIADELTSIIPANQPTNVMIYAGVSGALDMFARQRNLQLAFSYFRYAPDDHPEQYLLDRHVQFIVYPVGNAFAAAKYPYLARFEEQKRGAVTFRPLGQITTSADGQLYIFWAVSW